MEEGGLQEKLIEEKRASREEGEEEIKLSRRLWEENKKLWKVAGPSICTRFSTFGVTVINQAFIGHIGATELATYALVFTVLVRFSNGILLGMASALETLCVQSYGAKQYHMLGIYLQRSWIILFICTLFILPIFIFTTPLLKLLGQEKSIAEMAGTISKWFIAVMFSYIWVFTLQMYLQSQSKNIIITYLAVLTFAIHLSLSWFATKILGLGLVGVMSSTIIVMWIPVVGQLGFVFFGGCPETWKGFSFSAFKDLWSITKVSLSSGVMLWFHQFHRYMKNVEVALDALSICLNINSVRVANELGAGSAKRAKFAIINVVVTSLIIGLILFTFFFVLRGKLAYIFTENTQVAEAVADLSPLLAFSILLNSVQPVLSGVAVGAGWQGVVAYVNITCYYLVGIPLGVVLGYVFDFHVKGIWMGMILGVVAQTIVLLYITSRTDWEKQVALSKERINKWYMKDQRHDEDST